MERQAPEGLQGVRRPRRHRGDPVQHDRGHLPWDRSGGQWVVPLQVHAARRAADDRRRPEAVGHPRRLRHEPWRRRPADRVDGVHRQGRRQVPGHHPGRVAAREDPQPAAALRDRARPRDPHLAADRLHGRIACGRHRRRSRADHRARLARRGEGDRDRPPDRCAPGQVRHARPDEHLRHAREGLAPGGEGRCARRPPGCGAVPAPLLSLPRARRGARPVRVRGAALRGGAPLQRHADPPGDRRARAHPRRGRGRERRHLRTHQGRGAGWAQRACGDLDGLHEGLRARSSTRTWSP